MNKAIVFIDCQNDFFKGPLSCGESAERIRVPLARRFEKAISDGEHIFITLDCHNSDTYSETREGSLFTLHCVEDSPGFELIEEMSNIIKFASVDSLANLVAIKKQSYICPELPLLLSRKNLDVIEFCGVATNICVLHNVLCAISSFPKTKIIVNEGCCASYDNSLHLSSINMMKDLGCEII